MIRRIRVPVTTTGSAGTATGSASWVGGRPGLVRAIKVDYHASAPGATTDLTVKRDSSTGTTIFTKLNSATDIDWTAVAAPGIDETGAATAATDLGSGGLPFQSGLHVSLAQTDALTNAAVVEFLVEV